MIEKILPQRFSKSGLVFEIELKAVIGEVDQFCSRNFLLTYLDMLL